VRSDSSCVPSGEFVAREAASKRGAASPFPAIETAQGNVEVWALGEGRFAVRALGRGASRSSPALRRPRRPPTRRPPTRRPPTRWLSGSGSGGCQTALLASPCLGASPSSPFSLVPPAADEAPSLSCCTDAHVVGRQSMTPRALLTLLGKPAARSGLKPGGNQEGVPGAEHLLHPGSGRVGGADTGKASRGEAARTSSPSR
jgi:hypothetical protein